jgi:hypothetical protein
MLRHLHYFPIEVVMHLSGERRAEQDNCHSVVVISENRHTPSS